MAPFEKTRNALAEDLDSSWNEVKARCRASWKRLTASVQRLFAAVLHFLTVSVQRLFAAVLRFLRARVVRPWRTGLQAAEQTRLQITGVRVALHLEETEARLVLMRGARPIRWGSVAMPAGLFREGLVADQEGLARLLEALFASVRAPRKEVRITLGGVHAITRTFTLPKLKPALVGEALRREMKREVPVPLDGHHMVWQVLDSDGDRMDAMVLAVPIAELEGVLRAARRARLQVAGIEWKPFSVTRAVGLPDAAIVVMEQGGFDILIVRRGIPAVARNVPYPQPHPRTAERTDLVARELSLTLGYAVEKNGDTLGVGLPLYLLGHDAGDEAVRQRLKEAAGSDVETLPAGERGFPAWEYAAGVGTALYPPKYRVLPTASLPDLTPACWRPRTVPIGQGVLVIGIAIAVGGSVLPLTHALRPDVEAAALHGSIAGTEREVIAVRGTARKARILQKETEELQARLATLQGRLAEVEKQDLSWPAWSRALPPELRVVGVTVVSENAESMSLSGYAPTHSDVVRYAQQLQRSGWFKDVVIGSILMEPGASPAGPTKFSIAAQKQSTEAFQ